MSLTWAKSMFGPIFGFSATEEDMRHIPNPAIELGVHVTTKTVQAGSLIGGLLLAPVRMAFSRGNTKLAYSVKRYGVRGAMLGAVLGPALTYARITKLDLTEEALYDRCYRLRHNKNQLLVDRATYFAAPVGALVWGAPGLGFGINGALVVAFTFNLYQRYAKSTPTEESKPAPLTDMGTETK